LGTYVLTAIGLACWLDDAQSNAVWAVDESAGEAPENAPAAVD